MFNTRVQTADNRVTSLVWGKGDVKGAHRVDELLANSEVMSAAVLSVIDAGGSIRVPGWHSGNDTLTRLVTALIQFPYQEGQRIKTDARARAAASCYGEITGIGAAVVYVRLDGELTSTPFKHSEIAEGFGNTSAATVEIAQKLGTATVLYYSRWGTIRLEQPDGTLEKFNLPGDHPDKTTAEYAVWRLLDTAYRTEWALVDMNEEYGHVCHKRP